MLSETVVQYLAIGAGIISVPLTSLFKNKGWDTRYKFALSTLVSVLASLGIVIPLEITQATPTNAGATIATSIAAAQILYKLLFQHTKVNATLTNSLVGSNKGSQE